LPALLQLCLSATQTVGRSFELRVEMQRCLKFRNALKEHKAFVEEQRKVEKLEMFKNSLNYL
jgi:hypothetical protein